MQTQSKMNTTQLSKSIQTLHFLLIKLCSSKESLELDSIQQCLEHEDIYIKQIPQVSLHCIYRMDYQYFVPLPIAY